MRYDFQMVYTIVKNMDSAHKILLEFLENMVSLSKDFFNSQKITIFREALFLFLASIMIGFWLEKPSLPEGNKQSFELVKLNFEKKVLQGGLCGFEQNT